MDTLRDVTFTPYDDDLLGALPFAALGHFDAVARNVTGLSTGGSSSSQAPVRAFELWGRTAVSAHNSVHVGTCAVAILDRSVPSLVVRRPLAIGASTSAASASDLLISSTDEQFAFDLLRAPLTRLLQELPRGGSFSVQGCFAMLQFNAGDPIGMRAMAQRCEEFVAALPQGALDRFPVASSADPLAA